MISKELAALNRERTTKKVIETLDRLKKRKKTITLSILAKEAKISRQTLYNRPDLKAKLDEVNSLILDYLKPTKSSLKKRTNSQEDRIKHLRADLAQANEDNLKLLDQNVLLTEANTKLQKKIAELEEKLYTDAIIQLVNRNDLC